MSATVRKRFLAKVSPEPNTGCWLWTGAISTSGYGRISVAGKARQAHRVSLWLAKRPIPSGMEVDHLCRVRCCVNPDHLEPVTSQENTRRGNAGRHHAAKTHCPLGHPYGGSNLYVNPRGRRLCRTCRRSQNRARRARASAVMATIGAQK